MKVYYLQPFTTTEKRPLTVHVVDLQSGETVSSATVTHTPPSGSALAISPTVSTPYVNFLAGAFTATGRHQLQVQATGSNGSKPEVRYIFDVV
jgi:hypothetical protein